MSSDIALGVATATFSSEIAVSEAVVIQYWKMATARKNVELMSLIAGSKQMPEYLEESVLNRAELAVRGSYLIKLSFDKGAKKRFEKLMLLEKRSGVLALVAGAFTGKFSKTISAHLVKVLEDKPTKVLAEAIIKNDMLGDELHLEAIRCLVSLPNVELPTDLFIKRLSVWADNEPELLKLLSSCDSLFGEQLAATLLSSSDISDKVRILALEKSVGKWVMGKGQDLVTFSVARLSIMGLLRNEGVGEEVLDLIDFYCQNGTSLDIVKAIKSSDYTTYNTRLNNLEESVKSCESVIGDHAATELLNEFNSSKCLEALYLNESISTSLRCKIILKYAAAADDNCYKFLLSQELTDEEAIAFYSVCPYFTSSDGFKLFADQRVGMGLCLKLEGEDGGEVAYFSRWILLQNVVKLVEVDDPLLLEVPWSFFEEIATTGWRWSSGEGLDISRKMFKALTQAQEREFLTPAAWEGYGVICEGFKGSVKELLYTCKVV
jgi:hypothetical protein